jgi:hypothetical protein
MTINKRCRMECVDKEGKPRMATPKTEMCGVCGNNISGWLRRRVADRLRYRDTLALRARRMDMVSSEVGESKIADIRPYLKGAKAAKAKRSA